MRRHTTLALPVPLLPQENRECPAFRVSPDQALLLGEVPELWVELELGQRREGVRGTGNRLLPDHDVVDDRLEQPGLLQREVVSLCLDRGRVAAAGGGGDQLVGMLVAVATDVVGTNAVEDAVHCRVR